MGGIQKSLVELVNEIIDQYDVSVYCVEENGCLVQNLSKDVKIISGTPYASIPESSGDQLLKARRYWCFFLRVLLVAITRIGLKPYAVKLFLFFMSEIKGEYDIAISYSQPIDDNSFSKLTNEITLFKCNAIKKITFVHCDFESYGGNTAYNRSLYHQFDMVAAVSDSVGDVIKRCANLQNERVSTVYNICNTKKIHCLSMQEPLMYRAFTFIIVARLSKEKGVDRAVRCCKRLKSEGYYFELHIIGDGNLRIELQNQIIRFGLESYVVLHGEQINPYKFMKNANCIIVPSYHEAAPMVFIEALMLGVPIITTNTLSAEEIVGTNGGGIICENNENAIYDSMKYVLDNGIVAKPIDAVRIGRSGVAQFSNLIDLLLNEK